MPQKIEISSRTIIFTVLFLLGLRLLWQIKELIFSLFIAFIIAGALRPVINFLEKKRLPRTLACFLVYFLFVFFIFNLFALILPPLLGEIVALFRNLPQIIIQVFPGLFDGFNFDFLSQNIPSIANEVVGFIRAAFSNVIFVTSTLFFGFHFLLEKEIVHRLFSNFFDDLELNRMEMISEKAQRRMSRWFWGEIILMIVVGVLTYIGLNLIGMKYALALAVLAGILEVVPNLGPIVATIPAFLIGISYSSLLGLSTVALYFIVQQLENNLIVPLVMKKVVGLHPITTLIVLIIGGKLAGVIGVLLAVPTTIFLETILFEVSKMQKKVR